MCDCDCVLVCVCVCVCVTRSAAAQIRRLAGQLPMERRSGAILNKHAICKPVLGGTDSAGGSGRSGTHSAEVFIWPVTGALAKTGCNPSRNAAATSRFNGRRPAGHRVEQAH
jgi:hypothetical protein